MSSPEELLHFLTAPVVLSSRCRAGTPRLPPLHARIFPCILSFSLRMLLWVCVSAATMVLAQAPAPQTADTLWKEARTAYEAKQHDDAQQLFDEFLRRYSTDERAIEARVYNGIFSYRKGRKVQAVVEWDRVATLEVMNQRHGSALLLALDQLAAHYRAENKPDDWRKTIGQLLKAFPEDAVTIREVTFFARQSLAAGDWATAASAFARIEPHLTPQDTDGLTMARVMNAGDGAVSILIRIASARLDEDKVDLAAQLYTEALKRRPADNEQLEILAKFGWCCYLQNKHADAEKLWLQAIANGQPGNHWRGRSRWHLIALNAGPYANAKKAMELCEIQAKEFAGGFLGQQAMLTRAWLLKITKKWADAKIAFDALIAAYPHKADSPPIRAYIEECEKMLAGKK